jgi:autotransporter-associated beta strand protein
MTLNNGMLTDYYRATTTFSGGLGTGPNQIQIYGDSGFGGGNGNSTWRIGAAGSVLTWGSTHFNPTSLKFLTSADNMGPSTYGQASLDNGLNLNGAARTINVLAATGANALTSSWAKINGAISGSGGSLIKTGGGNLVLAGAGTYNGGTTVQAGMLQLGNATALGATSGPLTVNGGLLNLNDQNASIGNLTGTGGTIANNGNAARTLTIGTGNADGGIYQGIIANRTNTGTGSVALTKSGSGTITLTGSNTYAGATAITGGTLIITGAVQATTAITLAANSSLGLVIGSPVTAASAAVNFANGSISITGTPSSSSHVLLTALSFAGPPTLASPVAGYELKVIGNQLQLNQIKTNPYTAWSGGAAFEADSNNDGVDNGLAWILGATDPNAHAASLLPTLDNTSDPDYFIFNYRRSDAAAADANTSMKVQYGSTLAGWTDAIAGPDVIVTPFNDFHAAGIDKVAVKIRRTLAVGGKLFTRLQVTGTP